MKTKIEVLGEISEIELERLHEKVRQCSWSDLVPGDGVVIAEKEGQPPRIAYLNRRIHVRTDEMFAKLIFEVGVAQRSPRRFDKQKLFADLQEFVVKKSAAFSRPDMAAKELANFFINYTGE
jgi:hypothetical protein